MAAPGPGSASSSAASSSSAPSTAPRAPSSAARPPILFQGERIAELDADGCPDPALLGELAPLLALYCLVGWDTGGVPWDESA